MKERVTVCSVVQTMVQILHSPLKPKQCATVRTRVQFFLGHFPSAALHHIAEFLRPHEHDHLIAFMLGCNLATGKDIILRYLGNENASDDQVIIHITLDIILEALLILGSS